jgi:hypothetical protein
MPSAEIVTLGSEFIEFVFVDISEISVLKEIFHFFTS